MPAPGSEDVEALVDAPGEVLAQVGRRKRFGWTRSSGLGISPEVSRCAQLNAKGLVRELRSHTELRWEQTDFVPRTGNWMGNPLTALAGASAASARVPQNARDGHYGIEAEVAHCELPRAPAPKPCVKPRFPGLPVSRCAKGSSPAALRQPVAHLRPGPASLGVAFTRWSMLFPRSFCRNATPRRSRLLVKVAPTTLTSAAPVQGSHRAGRRRQRRRPRRVVMVRAGLWAQRRCRPFGGRRRCLSWRHARPDGLDRDDACPDGKRWSLLKKGSPPEMASSPKNSRASAFTP